MEDFTFMSRKKNISDPADKRGTRFELYVNKSHGKAFWDFVDSLKDRNLSPSLVICNIIADALESDSTNLQPNNEKPSPIKIQHKREEQSRFEERWALRLGFSPLRMLIQTSKTYKDNRSKGNTLTIGEQMQQEFMSEDIQKEDMINMILFIFESYLGLIQTDCTKNFLTEQAPKLMESMDRFTNPRKYVRFKQKLQEEVFRDFNRVEQEKKEEEERIQKEKDDWNHQIRCAEYQVEQDILYDKKLAWAKETGHEPFHYGMTEDEIQASNYVAEAYLRGEEDALFMDCPNQNEVIMELSEDQLAQQVKLEKELDQVTSNQYNEYQSKEPDQQLPAKNDDVSSSSSKEMMLTQQLLRKNFKISKEEEHRIAKDSFIQAFEAINKKHGIPSSS